MNIVACSGSFDPITNGHLFVIKEACRIADHVKVFVAVNPNKKTMFSVDERVRMINAVLHENGIINKVDVEAIEGQYVAVTAKEQGINFILRGIRNTTDFEYENIIQDTNRSVLNGASTIFTIPPKELAAVSSSFVKSLIGPPNWEQYISQFLPRAAFVEVVKKIKLQNQ